MTPRDSALAGWRRSAGQGVATHPKLFAMGRTANRFICGGCGSIQTKWAGKCPDCGQWDALEQYTPPPGIETRGTVEEGPEAISFAQLADAGTTEPGGASDRMATGITELDRVLGASGEGEHEVSATRPSGLVPGAAVLVGGDPGIGKSTLLLQAAHGLARQGRRVLYVTSEESVQQMHLRARRLRACGEGDDRLFVLAETNLHRVIEQIQRTRPDVVVIDSIQMVYKADLSAAPGTVSQLRACCLELVYTSRSVNCAVLLVGHVTKEGQLAGPRLLEHLVDAVLYFEGDRYHSHRVIRAVKNRFGTTLEVGLFEMTDGGLEEVRDGAALRATEYRPQVGSVVCPILQGSRCLLVEVQALTATGVLGAAKRRTSGLDGNRLAMLIAVLEKHGGHRLADQDIFASSVGGMRIVEPAADLAVALAIAGTHLNRPLDLGRDEAVAAVGEIGLGGEIRHVHQLEQRVREAARLGFLHIIAPPGKARAPSGCRVTQVSTLGEALGLLG